MKYNLGKKDRMIRLFIAAVLLVLYFNRAANDLLSYLLISGVVILTFTSLFSFCPLYALFGWNSNGLNKTKSEF